MPLLWDLTKSSTFHIPPPQKLTRRVAVTPEHPSMALKKVAAF